MKRIAIVGCCKKKLDKPAKDLYCSPLFRAPREYAERFCDEWVILSAVHGVVEPNQVIAPYEFALSSVTRSEREEWAMVTHWSLVSKFPFHHCADVDFVELVGYPYARALCGFRTTAPLLGLGIGQRIAWLKRRLEDVQVGRQIKVTKNLKSADGYC